MARKKRKCASCAALRKRVAELERENAALRAQMAMLLKRIQELEARLGENSSNSSKPPSSDPPWAPAPKPKRKPSGRKPGGQPGHPGKTRELWPMDQVDRVESFIPKRCRHCEADLTAESGGKVIGNPVRHQVSEVPRAVAYVTEYQLFSIACPMCGKVTRAELPDGVPNGCVGPRLQAVMSMLTGRFRISRREAAEATAALYGEKAEVSVGTVVELEGKTSEALKVPFEEALAAVREASVAHVDETGWKVNGKRAWLWVAVTAILAVFRIDRKRSREALKRLLGAFKGILVTDRWSAYSFWANELRQICWAHLKRDFQKLVDRGGAALEIGQWGLEEVGRLFHIWHGFQAGLFDQCELQRKLVMVKARFGRLLRRGASSGDGKVCRFCRKLQKLWPALWTFARVEGVEPTNNRAERCLRPAVLWRKGSFGTQTEDGNRFVERMLTVVQSLRMQRRPVLDFVEEAICAHMLGQHPPSLLPAMVPAIHTEEDKVHTLAVPPLFAA